MEVDEQSGNPSIDESKIIKRGILNKKGRRKLFRPWTLRTIIIDDQDKLLYFKGSVLKGEVMLKDIHVRHLPPEKADGKKFAFEISNIPSDSPLRSDSLLLAAATEAEAADWVDIISSIVFKKSSSKTNFEYESFQVYLILSFISLCYMSLSDTFFASFLYRQLLKTIQHLV